MQQLRLFFIALQFLTRLPCPRWVGFDPAWLNASARWFPAVGSVVGAVGAAVLLLAGVVFPATVAVGLSMAATILLTGAFHEDGLADTCDALGGAVSRERALEIMKDSRIGTYGATGLVLVLGLKAAALAALPGAWAAAALLAAHTASRAVAVVVMQRLPYAGDVEHAKAKPLATSVHGRDLAIALAWTTLLLIALVMTHALDVRAVAALAVAGLAVAAAAIRWLRRRLGGYTGDALGATQQIAELTMLLAVLGTLAWLR